MTTNEKWNTDEEFDYDLCFTEGGEAMSAFQVFDESSWPVAAIWADNHFAPFPVAKKRARLIAAAPELVAALEAIQNELGVPQPGYPQPVANAYQIAADVLARVRGESEGGEG